jgi:hypothetical protein
VVDVILSLVLMGTLQLLYQLQPQEVVLVLVGLDHHKDKVILEDLVEVVLEMHLQQLQVMLEDLVHQKVNLDQLLHLIMVREVEVVEPLKQVKQEQHLDIHQIE